MENHASKDLSVKNVWKRKAVNNFFFFKLFLRYIKYLNILLKIIQITCTSALNILWIKMLAFLIDNIFVAFRNLVFQQSCDYQLRLIVSIYAMTSTWKKIKSLDVSFYSTFRYINDILSIDNCYVYSILKYWIFLKYIMS